MQLGMRAMLYRARETCERLQIKSSSFATVFPKAGDLKKKKKKNIYIYIQVLKRL